MSDFDNLVPIIAGKLGLAPGTLLLLLMVLHRLAVVGNRRIPNDATGFWGFVRQTCAIIAIDPSSRVTSDVTVQDVAAKLAPVAAATDLPLTMPLSKGT